MRVGDVSVGNVNQANAKNAMGVAALKKSQKIHKDMAMQLIDSVPTPKPIHPNKVDVRV
jgi:hypothetical protein